MCRFGHVCADLAIISDPWAFCADLAVFIMILTRIFRAYLARLFACQPFRADLAAFISVATRIYLIRG